MMRFDSLASRPRHFHNFSGFTVIEFQKLAETIREDWEQARTLRLKRRRQRKIGGGSKPKLPTLEDRLLVYGVYAKLYPTYLLLEYLFGVDESTVCRIVQEMSGILGRTLIVRKGGKQISTLEELREVIPDLDEVLVDATEQRVNRPEKKKRRKQHHSGKKKAFTLKTQLVATRSKIVLHVSDTSPGRVHDYKLFKKTPVPKWLEDNPGIKGRMDLGYQGATKDYPKATIILPTKRNRSKKKLTRSEKIQNTKKAKARIFIENTIANLKKFKILADIYRNAKERYALTFKSVCFLSNFRTLERLPV